MPYIARRPRSCCALRPRALQAGPARGRAGGAGRPRQPGGDAHRRRQVAVLPAARAGDRRRRALPGRGRQPADRADERPVAQARAGGRARGDARVGHGRTATTRARCATSKPGVTQLVLAAPERFASGAFRQALARRRVALFVVDEAHCVAEWGHDFRPDYLRLRDAIASLSDGHEHDGQRPAVMAATATATPRVAQEIAARLGLREWVSIRSGFDRPNLTLRRRERRGQGRGRAQARGADARARRPRPTARRRCRRSCTAARARTPTRWPRRSRRRGSPRSPTTRA